MGLLPYLHLVAMVVNEFVKRRAVKMIALDFLHMHFVCFNSSVYSYNPKR